MPEAKPTVHSEQDVAALIRDIGGKLGDQLNEHRTENIRRFEEMEKRFGPMLAARAVQDEPAKGAAEVATELERDPAKVEKLVRGKPVERKERMLLSVEEDTKRGFKPGENPDKALGRIIIGAARAHRDRVDIAEGIRRVGYDATASEYERHLRALSSTTSGAGADLIPAQYSSDFIEFLRPNTVIRDLGCPVISMPGGQIDIGRQNGTATASWVGDPSSVNESSLTTGRTGLNAKKMAIITAISNDLIRRSVPGADGLVQQDVLAAAGVEEDVQFLRGLGSVYRPKGIRWTASSTNIFAANGTFNFANGLADSTKMIRLVAEGNIPGLMSAQWVMPPRSYFAFLSLAGAANLQGASIWTELRSMAFLGFKLRWTTQIPTNLGGGTDSENYFIVPQHIVIGDTLNVEVTVSQEASYSDSGGTAQSTFVRDETAIRLIKESDINMRHTRAAAILYGVNWI